MSCFISRLACCALVSIAKCIFHTEYSILSIFKSKYVVISTNMKIYFISIEQPQDFQSTCVA